MNKLLVALFAVGVFSILAQAETYKCTGDKDTKGEATVTINGDNATISATYHFEAQGETATAEVKLDCSATLDNRGQAGIKTHDYYQLEKNCRPDYLRTTKNILARQVAWVDVVTARPANPDEPNYEYANFRCAR